MVSLPRCKQLCEKENKPNSNFNCKWSKINVLVLADIQTFADRAWGRENSMVELYLTFRCAVISLIFCALEPSGKVLITIAVITPKAKPEEQAVDGR